MEEEPLRCIPEDTKIRCSGCGLYRPLSHRAARAEYGHDRQSADRRPDLPM